MSGATTAVVHEQAKSIEGAQERAKPVAVEQSARHQALEQRTRAKSLQNGTLLTAEQRKEFFDGFVSEGGIGSYLTSKGTGIALQHYERRALPVEGYPDGFSLMYRSPDKRTAYTFDYDATGRFQKLEVMRAKTVEERQDPSSGSAKPFYRYEVVETHTNLWAEKRGDSFIKNVQRTNRKDTEGIY